MNLSEINWFGVLLGSLSGFILGALWYGPLFGKLWMAALGITKDDAKKTSMGWLFAKSGVTYVVLGITIAIFINMIPSCCTESYCCMQGALIGGLIGLANTSNLVNNALYEMKSTKLMLINGAYALLNGALIGGVIGSFY